MEPMRTGYLERKRDLISVGDTEELPIHGSLNDAARGHRSSLLGTSREPRTTIMRVGSATSAV